MIALLIALAGLQAAAPTPAPAPAVPAPAVKPLTELWTLDQIRVPSTEDIPALLKLIEPIHSIEGVVTALNLAKIGFTREVVTIDASKLPGEMAGKLLSYPKTEPFAIPVTGAMTVNIILARRPLPVAPPPALPRAPTTRPIRGKAIIRA